MSGTFKQAFGTFLRKGAAAPRGSAHPGHSSSKHVTASFHVLNSQNAALQVQLYKKILLKGLKNICFQQYLKQVVKALTICNRIFPLLFRTTSVVKTSETLY